MNTCGKSILLTNEGADGMAKLVQEAHEHLVFIGT